MADLLEEVGVARSAIVLEPHAQNTHEHAVYLCPIFREHHIKSVLLVTSAMHMPRALAAFQHSCSTAAYTPAPTDFRVTDGVPLPRWRRVVNIFPTTRALLDFTGATHEYLGLTLYRLRGWA